MKNTLTLLAADRAGAEDLKELLEGPTAFTFVTPDGGDVALAAKALAQFRRETELLEFKGGRMNGEPLTVEQIQHIARLPGVEVLHGQLVGTLASPVTGLVRGLNQLVAGLAQQLGQIADQGLIGGGDAPAPDPNEADVADKNGEDAAATDAEGGTDEPETEAPSEGEEQKEG